MHGKQLAGEKAVEYIQHGMIVGLGTGSTVNVVLNELGKRAKEGLNIKGVATSKFTEERANERNIPLVDVSEIDTVDLMIDGADEVSDQFDLIKGAKGALLREKMIATSSNRFIVVIGEKKCVKNLGAFPLPVEIVPYAWQVTFNQLDQLGCRPNLRRAETNIPYLTDNGNYIVDCHFENISEPSILATRINMIPGVVENGLFTNLVDTVIIGTEKGEVEVKVKQK
ncbi:ribose-5-phosphate isomerase RpiA [Gracilibacillus salitolerans]|uniref:Ribose-5-phosphate isomerase A n=1 Tax=Gracilibacillus salitolerans TaxID=2663022 RepID=A0A5Q2TLR8_9BACI|nr:ribose-5-phosphate isomerase RpiA [Gracilibacillus salitolerans]QGH35027.1 ribose-5-phosphate isomerase RpiA [Gracilibacillus salitolerans]